jgi:hypothetical protein
MIIRVSGYQKTRLQDIWISEYQAEIRKQKRDERRALKLVLSPFGYGGP